VKPYWQIALVSRSPSFNAFRPSAVTFLPTAIDALLVVMSGKFKVCPQLLNPRSSEISMVI
jgi:hypothetical protein